MLQRILAVSEVNQFIKQIIEDEPLLSSILVRGEISNYKVYPSGHHYFTLKDGQSALRCVIFAGATRYLRFRPENGMKVVAAGKISVYPRDGAYQLYCTRLVSDGVGDLHIAFEQLKQKLYAQGLFAPEHKKPLPLYPRCIAIITSPAGAAVHDMIRILRRRYPIAKVLLLPVRVQGVEAPPEIVGAIRYANRWQLADVLIVGRGGGSIEDLWAFNEEIMARAVFDCSVPVISAVGHETDTTIIDYVADLRAPTPSAAAELAVMDVASFDQQLMQYRNRLDRDMMNVLQNKRQQLAQLKLRVTASSPEIQLLQKKQYLDELSNRLQYRMQEKYTASRNRLELFIEKLNGLSPLRRLSRGYAYVEDDKGSCLTSVSQVKAGDSVKIHVTDGYIRALVQEKETIERQEEN